jgi:hypothetical protein
MAKIDVHNLQEFDAIIERLKKFRDYLDKNKGWEPVMTTEIRLQKQ